MSSMFCASRQKSSSSTIVSAKSSTSAGGLASAATGMRPISRGANHDIARMSSRTRRATCGRCTFTTTSSPVRRRAACTWAIDAAASGVRSNRSNTSSSERPSSSSTTRRTTSNGSGGTRSRSCLNSATSSGGNSPSPPEMIWPSLIYVGPRGANAWRSRRDSPRRPYSCPRRLSTMYQPPSATPTRLTTRRTRLSGGRAPGWSQTGNSSRACVRRRSTSGRQVISSGMTTHGPRSLNEPIARSGDFAGDDSIPRPYGPCRTAPGTRPVCS